MLSVTTLWGILIWKISQNSLLMIVFFVRDYKFDKGNRSWADWSWLLTSNCFAVLTPHYVYFFYIFAAQWNDHTHYRDSSSTLFPGVIPRSWKAIAVGWSNGDWEISNYQQLHSANACRKVSQMVGYYGLNLSWKDSFYWGYEYVAIMDLAVQFKVLTQVILFSQNVSRFMWLFQVHRQFYELFCPDDFKPNSRHDSFKIGQVLTNVCLVE